MLASCLLFHAETVKFAQTMQSLKKPLVSITKKMIMIAMSVLLSVFAIAVMLILY
jgi:hypothetical protein